MPEASRPNLGTCQQLRSLITPRQLTSRKEHCSHCALLLQAWRWIIVKSLIGTRGSKSGSSSTSAQKEKVPKTVQPSQPSLKHSGKSRQPTHAPCPSCGKVLLIIISIRRNLFRHQKQVHGDIKSFNPFPAKIVDLKEGIFMVARSHTGGHHPIHVQRKVSTMAMAQHLLCEWPACQEAARACGRGNITSYTCPHLNSVNFAEGEDDQLRQVTADSRQDDSGGEGDQRVIAPEIGGGD